MPDASAVADAIPLPPQSDLPAGPTWRCSRCGARLRTGEIHCGIKPSHSLLFGTRVTLLGEMSVEERQCVSAT